MPIRSSEIGIFKVSPVNSIWQSLGNVMKLHIPLTFPPSEKKRQPKHSRIRTSKIMKWYYEMSILQKRSFLKKNHLKTCVRSKNQTNQLLHCEGQWVAGLIQTPRVTACYQCCWFPRTPARLPAIECDNSSAMIWSVVLPTNLHW